MVQISSSKPKGAERYTPTRLLEQQRLTRSRRRIYVLTDQQNLTKMRGINSAMKLIAEVVKLVDALASGASERKLVEVQVLSSAPLISVKSVDYDISDVNLM